MALRAPVPSGGQQKQAKASLLLSELNALIATNEPAQRSRVREAFNEALTTFFDLGTDVVNHLDGVPVVSEWLPPVKVIFWLGVVFCHRRDARDACREFGRLLGDGYSVAVQLDLGEHSYARKVLDDVSAAFLAYADKRKLREHVEGGVRKLWYDTSNAFQRENVVGYFKQLCDSLNSRCMLLTLMLVQSQHDCIVLERYNVPLDPPKPPPIPFLGRSDRLQLLRGALNDKSLLIHGQHGIGKTSFARKALQDVYAGQRQVVLSCGAVDDVGQLKRELLRIRLERLRREEVVEDALQGALNQTPTVVFLDDLERLWLRDAPGVEKLLLLLVSLSGVTLVLTGPGKDLYDQLKNPDFALVPIAPFSLDERRQLFLHFAPDHLKDSDLDDLLVAIGGQPLVVRDVALQAAFAGPPLRPILDQWRNEIANFQPGQGRNGNLRTSISLALKRLADVAHAKALLALLLRLPHGLDRTRLPDGLCALAITALVNSTGLAFVGSPTLQLFPPVREILERDGDLRETALPLDVIDALVESFSTEALAHLRKYTPRRLDVPVRPPASPDWRNLPAILELAVEVESKHLGKLVDAVQGLIIDLPLPGELADFMCATQSGLEQRFEKVIEMVDRRDQQSGVGAILRGMLGAVTRSRVGASLSNLSILPSGVKGSHVNLAKFLEQELVAQTPLVRLNTLLSFQVAKWSGDEHDLRDIMHDVERLDTVSLSGWLAFEQSFALVDKLLSPKAPSSLEEIHARYQLYDIDGDASRLQALEGASSELREGFVHLPATSGRGVPSAPQAPTTGGKKVHQPLSSEALTEASIGAVASRFDTPKERKVVERIFDLLDQTEGQARGAGDDFLLGYALVRHAGLATFFSGCGPAYSHCIRDAAGSAKAALAVYEEICDTSGLVMLLKYVHACSVASPSIAARIGFEQEAIELHKLRFEIFDALHDLDPPESVIRAALDTLELDPAAEARLLATARARLAARGPRQMTPTPPPPPLFSLERLASALGFDPGRVGLRTASVQGQGEVWGRPGGRRMVPAAV